jgi:hypothetical protein
MSITQAAHLLVFSGMSRNQGGHRPNFQASGKNRGVVAIPVFSEK